MKTFDGVPEFLYKKGSRELIMTEATAESLGGQQDGWNKVHETPMHLVDGTETATTSNDPEDTEKPEGKKGKTTEEGTIKDTPKTRQRRVTGGKVDPNATVPTTTLVESEKPVETNQEPKADESKDDKKPGVIDESQLD